MRTRIAVAVVLALAPAAPAQSPAGWYPPAPATAPAAVMPNGLVAPVLTPAQAVASAPALVTPPPPVTVAPPPPPPAPTPEPAPRPAANPKLEASWNNGVFVQSPDKDFVAHVGGVFQMDGVWYDAQASQRYPGGTGAFNDAVDVRRARIRTEGTFSKSFDWVFELDFAAAGFNPTNDPASIRNTFWAPAPTDMWIQIKDVPYVGTVRIGQQKEPFSLERLNSARLLNFLERSYLTDANQTSAFNNNRSPGVSVFRNAGPDDRIYMSMGAFKNVSSLYGYGVGDGEYAVTGRVTGLVFVNEAEKSFWHVGGAMSHRDPVGDAVRLRVRPNVRVNPLPFVNVIADTGAVPADSQDLYGIETAGVYKSFTFQSEYQAYVVNGARVNGSRVGSALFSGWYAEALYFLTGESRPWNQKAAVFGRVVPNDPLKFENGCMTGRGAWEVAARYSTVNLTDGRRGIYGGQLESLTLGLNWYWTSNARMQFNYDYTYRDNAASPLTRGVVHGFGTRLAYDF